MKVCVWVLGPGVALRHDELGQNLYRILSPRFILDKARVKFLMREDRRRQQTVRRAGH